MAEQVVQVAGDAGALVLGGQPGHLGAGGGQLVVGPDEAEEAPHRHGHQRDRDQPVDLNAGVPRGYQGRHERRDQRERGDHRNREPAHQHGRQYRDVDQHDERAFVREHRLDREERQHRQVPDEEPDPAQRPRGAQRQQVAGGEGDDDRVPRPPRPTRARSGARRPRPR